MKSERYLDDDVQGVEYSKLYNATKNMDGSWTLAGETRRFKFL